MYQCTGCAVKSRSGDGWLSIPSMVPSLGAGITRHACPACAAKAIELGLKLVSLLHTSDVGLYSLSYGAGMLHHPLADPLVDRETLRADPAMAPFKRLLGPEPTDLPRIDFVMTAKRSVCGCGKCDNMTFDVPPEMGTAGSFARFCPQDLGMKVVHGEKIRVLMERVVVEPATEPQLRWGYGPVDAETYYRADCREDAIRLGTDRYDGGRFEVAHGHLCSAAQFVQVEEMLEQASQAAYEAVDEAAERWHPDEVDQVALKKVITDWLDTRCPCDFWQAEDVEQIDPCRKET